MNDLLSNTWLWVILAIIFIIIAVIIYHTSNGYTGWYWLFIVLAVISLILAFLAYSRHRAVTFITQELPRQATYPAYRSPRQSAMY